MSASFVSNAHSSSSSDSSDRRVHERRALHTAIKARWGKFTEFEVGALADTGDLINQVALKYGLELSRARSEVEALLNGRKV